MQALSDAEAARVINDQRVHVLINLIGHTAGARHMITEQPTQSRTCTPPIHTPAQSVGR